MAQELSAAFTAGDVADKGFSSRVAEEAGDFLAGLVYAVGTLHLRSLHRLSERDFLHDYRVNALGAALAVQAALPALKKSATALQWPSSAEQPLSKALLCIRRSRSYPLARSLRAVADPMPPEPPYINTYPLIDVFQ